MVYRLNNNLVCADWVLVFRRLHEVFIMLNPSKFNSYGRLDVAETEIKLLKTRITQLERDIVKQRFNDIKGQVIDKHA